MRAFMLGAFAGIVAGCGETESFDTLQGAPSWAYGVYVPASQAAYVPQGGKTSEPFPLDEFELHLDEFGGFTAAVPIPHPISDERNEVAVFRIHGRWTLHEGSVVLDPDAVGAEHAPMDLEGATMGFVANRLWLEAGEIRFPLKSGFSSEATPGKYGIPMH